MSDFTAKDIQGRACANVHQSVCHTPSLTVLSTSPESLTVTEYVSYGKESLIREHAKSRLKANLWLTGPVGFCWAFPWLQRCDLFDLSINTSHAHFLNFFLAVCPDNENLHMRSDSKAALSSKSPVSVIRERCHPTVGICLPSGIYPYALLKAKLCGIEAGGAFKMLLSGNF